MKNIVTLSLVCSLMIYSSTSLAEERSAESIHQSLCATCHVSGVANAPKSHDEAAWKARGKSLDELVASSKKGINAMPPMGLCADCTDAELKAAIEFMMKAAPASGS